ncbi:MAG: TrkA family potassium uptake protein [Lachnospiraceae bacterium]|nr:TrkA family potassium uptake protein [Lachnospiraceae bacterium]
MSKKEYIVIGLGQFGTSIAKALMQNDCEVLTLDINEEKTRAIADTVTCAVTGNVLDPELVPGLGIRNFDGAIIAIGEDMEASIMATMVVSELGVPHILAKAQSELHAKILRKVGADRVVLPENEVGIRYANNLVHGNFFDAVELSPDISIMEINMRREWEGKSLKQLNMRAKYKINVIGIKSEDGFEVNPDADEPLLANSQLVAIGRNEVLNKLAEGRL